MLLFLNVAVPFQEKNDVLRLILTENETSSVHQRNYRSAEYSAIDVKKKAEFYEKVVDVEHKDYLKTGKSIFPYQ